MRINSTNPHLVLCVAATFCWGAATTLTKVALNYMDPGLLLIVQLAASIAFLAPITALKSRRTWQNLPHPRVILLGLLEPGLAYFLALQGLKRITATEAVVLSSSEAFMIVVLSWLIVREPLRASIVCLSVVGAGGALMISGDHLALTGLGSSLTGDALLFGGIFCAAIYVVLSGRWATAAEPATVLLCQQACALALALLLHACLPSHPVAPASIPMAGWAIAAASGVVQYACAFWLYLQALKGVRTSVAGLLLTLVPVFGIAVSVPALGDRLSTVQWFGAFVVLLSVSLLGWIRQPVSAAAHGEAAGA